PAHHGLNTGPDRKPTTPRPTIRPSHTQQRDNALTGTAPILDYQPKKITVTLDPPGSPRLTRALTLLIDEINQTPPHLPGDTRPITYHLAPTQQ
ncbi:hypothetical protein ACWD7F_31440, partial [Streptomyces sp. NPDC005122]